MTFHNYIKHSKKSTKYHFLKDGIMTIRKFTGVWNKDLKWDGARTRQYNNQVTETWMIGKKEGRKILHFVITR